MNLRRLQLYVVMFLAIIASYNFGSSAFNRSHTPKPPSFELFETNNFTGALFANPNREVVNQRFVNDFVSFSSAAKQSGFALQKSDGSRCRFLDSSAPGRPTFFVASENTTLAKLFRENVLPDNGKYLLMSFGVGALEFERFNVVPSVVVRNSNDEFCCEDVDYDNTVIEANDVIVYYSFGDNFSQHISKVCELDIPDSNPLTYGRIGWHLKALSSPDFLDYVDEDLDLDFLWKLDESTAQSSLVFDYRSFNGESVKEFLTNQNFEEGLYWAYLTQKPVQLVNDPPPENPSVQDPPPANPPVQDPPPANPPVQDPPGDPVELPRFSLSEEVKHAKFTGPVNFACSFDRSSVFARVEILIDGADSATLDEFDLVGLGHDVEVLFDFDRDGVFEILPADGLQVTPGFYDVEYVFDYSELVNQFANVRTEVPQIAMGDFTTESINFNFIFNPCVFDALDVSLTSDKNFDGQSILSCREGNTYTLTVVNNNSAAVEFDRVVLPTNDIRGQFLKLMNPDVDELDAGELIFVLPETRILNPGDEMGFSVDLGIDNAVDFDLVFDVSEVEIGDYIVNGVDVDPVESCVNVRPAPVVEEPGDQALNWFWGTAKASEPEDVQVNNVEVFELDCDNQDLEIDYTAELLNQLGSQSAYINKLNFGYFVNDQFTSQVAVYDQDVSVLHSDFEPLNVSGLPFGEHVIWAQFEFDEFGGRQLIEDGITNLTLDIESDWVALLKANQTCENVITVNVDVENEVCEQGDQVRNQKIANVMIENDTLEAINLEGVNLSVGFGIVGELSVDSVGPGQRLEIEIEFTGNSLDDQDVVFGFIFDNGESISVTVSDLDFSECVDSVDIKKQDEEPIKFACENLINKDFWSGLAVEGSDLQALLERVDDYNEDFILSADTIDGVMSDLSVQFLQGGVDILSAVTPFESIVLNGVRFNPQGDVYKTQNEGALESTDQFNVKFGSFTGFVGGLDPNVEIVIQFNYHGEAISTPIKLSFDCNKSVTWFLKRNVSDIRDLRDLPVLGDFDMECSEVLGVNVAPLIPGLRNNQLELDLPAGFDVRTDYFHTENFNQLIPFDMYKLELAVNSSYQDAGISRFIDFLDPGKFVSAVDLKSDEISCSRLEASFFEYGRRNQEQVLKCENFYDEAAATRAWIPNRYALSFDNTNGIFDEQIDPLDFGELVENYPLEVIVSRKDGESVSVNNNVWSDPNGVGFTVEAGRSLGFFVDFIYEIPSYSENEIVLPEGDTFASLVDLGGVEIELNSQADMSCHIIAIKTEDKALDSCTDLIEFEYLDVFGGFINGDNRFLEFYDSRTLPNNVEVLNRLFFADGEILESALPLGSSDLRLSSLDFRNRPSIVNKILTVKDDPVDVSCDFSIEKIEFDKCELPFNKFLRFDNLLKDMPRDSHALEFDVYIDSVTDPVVDLAFALYASEEIISTEFIPVQGVTTDDLIEDYDDFYEVKLRVDLVEDALENIGEFEFGMRLPPHIYAENMLIKNIRFNSMPVAGEFIYNFEMIDLPVTDDNIRDANKSSDIAKIPLNDKACTNYKTYNLGKNNGLAFHNTGAYPMWIYNVNPQYKIVSDGSYLKPENYRFDNFSEQDFKIEYIEYLYYLDDGFFDEDLPDPLRNRFFVLPTELIRFSLVSGSILEEPLILQPFLSDKKFKCEILSSTPGLPNVTADNDFDGDGTTDQVDAFPNANNLIGFWSNLPVFNPDSDERSGYIDENLDLVPDDVDQFSFLGADPWKVFVETGSGLSEDLECDIIE